MSRAPRKGEGYGGSRKKEEGKELQRLWGRRAGAPELVLRKIEEENLKKKKMMLRVNRKGMKAAKNV